VGPKVLKVLEPRFRTIAQSKTDASLRLIDQNTRGDKVRLEYRRNASEAQTGDNVRALAALTFTFAFGQKVKVRQIEIEVDYQRFSIDGNTFWRLVRKENENEDEIWVEIKDQISKNEAADRKAANC
jgi:hypothetical protein